MPLIIDETGVQTQGQAEIFDELAEAVKDPAVWGPNADTRANSNIGRMLNTLAERESAVQSALETLLLYLFPSAAPGYHLDLIAMLTGVERQGATYALSASGQVTTTGPTTVPAGAIVRNMRTLQDWVIDADVVAAGAGDYAATIRGRETGVLDFLASDSWSIVTPALNWSTFEATADLDPEDAGTERETDAELRIRRNLAQLAAGNDFDAIVAGVEQVTGVTYVGGLNNRSSSTVDGVPGGAIEIVVDGGDDTEIAQAIYDRLPPGTEAFGTTYVDITTRLGDPLPVGFTRPTDIDLWLRATVSASGASYPYNPDIVNLLTTTLLDTANAEMAAPGVDVVPRSLENALWDVTRDARTGRPTLTSILVEVSTNGVSWQSTPYTLTHKQRADWDSARIVIVGP